MREFVRRNQASAIGGGNLLCPRTRTQLWIRNSALRLGPLLGLLSGVGNRTFTALEVEDYSTTDTVLLRDAHEDARRRVERRRTGD